MKQDSYNGRQRQEEIRLAHIIEGRLREIGAVKQTAVLLHNEPKPVPYWHMDELAGEESLAAAAAEVQSQQAASARKGFAASGPLAVASGQELLERAEEPHTLREALIQAAARHPEHGIQHILPDGTERFQSYEALLRDARRVLGGLRRKGLQPGQHVIFQLDDNQSFITCFWACVLGGFLPSPISVSPVFTEMNAVVKKLKNVWELLEQPIIVADDHNAALIQELPHLWGGAPWNVAAYSELDAGGAEEPDYMSTPNCLVLNLLTSGSTGIPKCVQHRNQSLIWRTKGTCEHNRFTSGDVSLNWMPLDHVGGIVMFHVRDVYLGCRQVLAKIDTVIAEPTRWLDWMDKYRATISWAPNFAFAMINDCADKIAAGNWDLSSMRYLLNGGEAVVAKVAHRFLQLLGRHGFPADAMVPSYGMSETSSGIFESRLNRDDTQAGIHVLDKNSLAGSLTRVAAGHPQAVFFTEVGVPLPGVSVRIVDEHDQPVCEFCIGRVQVQSQAIMNGYFNNPEANREVFLQDGWFNTGDMGFLVNGRLTITGREKDLIIINGANYYNYEIEALVEEVAGVEVTFAAACAVKDKHGQEQLALFFVPEPGYETERTLLPLIQKIKEKVVRALGIQPSVILPLDKAVFPKTNSGKIQRTELTNAYHAGSYRHQIRQLDLLEKNERTIPEWMYRPVWTEQGLNGNDGWHGQVQGLTIVFGRPGIHRNRYEQAVWIEPGSSYAKENSQRYRIRPDVRDDYIRAVREIAADFGKADQVVHAWTCGEAQVMPEKLDELRQAQHMSSFSLLHTLQALTVAGIEKCRLLAASSGAFRVQDSDIPAFAYSTMTGIVKTIPHEWPEYTCKQVDFAPGTPADELEGLITAELLTETNTDAIVAYRDGIRLVQRLARVGMKEASERMVPLRSGGLYLVTGGTGGIGRLVSKQLIEQYGAHVIVAGRSAISADRWTNEILPQFGLSASAQGSISYVQAALSDYDAMSGLIAELERTRGMPLAGVLHFAGIIQERLLAETSVADFEEMFEAKVYGTFVLHQILKERDEALFATASSARTISAGMTVGAYCSANGFMESLAQYEQQATSIRSCCLSWSLWEQVGMGGGLMIRRTLAARGYSPIDEPQGLLSFILGIKSGYPLLYVGLNAEKAEIRALCAEDDGIGETTRLNVVVAGSGAEWGYAQLEQAVREAVAGSEWGDAPLSLHVLDDIPEHGGEMDRDLLAELILSANSREQEPETEWELRLAQYWMDLLKLKAVGAQDNFFEIGGHSLKATQLISLLKNERGIALELRVLFENPTLRDLARVLEVSEQSSEAKGPTELETMVGRSGRPARLPMSSSQKRQWFLYQMEPNNPFYNNTIIVRIEGEIDIEAIGRSVQRIVDRHEALRTVFYVEEDFQGQRTKESVSVDMPLLDLRGRLPEEQAKERLNAVREQALLPFRLESGPLLRCMAVRTQDRVCELIVTIHHIVSDGWSIGRLQAEFTSFYEALLRQEQAAIADLPMQYADFAIWHESFIQSEAYRRQMDYWVTKLKDAVPTLELPLDKPRPPVQTYNGRILELNLESPLQEKLEKIAQQEGATLFMVLFAAFSALMHRYTGQTDMVLGSLIANRHHAALEPLIGFFTNTIALRADLSDNPVFIQLLQQIKRTTLEAHEHQDVQFEQLVDALRIDRDPSRHPLFQVLFVLQNALLAPIHTKSVSTSIDIHYSDTSKFDLSVHAFERTDGLRFVLEYNTDLFAEATMERLLGHFKELLAGIASFPEARISELPLLTGAERQLILQQWNGTRRAYPSDLSLHEWFERCVALWPDAVAVIDGNRELTYSEFNVRANRLARSLREQGIGPSDIAAVLADRSADMLIAIYAVLKAGGAYMPVDPSFPQERIEYMLGDSGAKALLTQERFSRYAAFGGIKAVFNLEDETDYAADGRNLDSVNTPADLAYVIYTSGSTGQPKGVMIEHGGVVNILHDLQARYPLTATDAYLFKTTFTFDVSVCEIFGWFQDGGRLIVLEQGGEKDPKAIIRAIHAHQATHINFVPSMLNAFLEAVEDGEWELLKPLKYVFAAGEALSPALAEEFNNLLRGVALENIYGPTEATIYATGLSLKDHPPGSKIGIGKPLGNMHAYIVDAYGQLQPVGGVGELCLAGKGIARGYLNNERLTNEKFVPNPFGEGRMYKTGDLARWTTSGDIAYLGRLDHQVKIRGYRIELGEIEAAIRSHEGISDCVAVAIAAGGAGGMNRLAAYYVSRLEHAPDWRAYLADRLPDYMIPSYFVELERIPLNSSGKVNRHALPAPQQAAEPQGAAAGEEPRTEAERLLASVWSRLLHLDRIGLHDDFFMLGGDSITLIQMISRLRKAGVSLPLKTAFRYKTIAQLAPHIVFGEAAGAASEEEGAEVPLTPIQHWFFEMKHAAPSYWNLPAWIKLKRYYPEAHIRKALLILLNHHDALRTQYRQEDGGWIAALSKPCSDAALAVCDLTGLPSDRRAAVIEAKAAEAQSGLRLETGELVKAILFEEEGRRQSLFLAVHHLAVDGISWRIMTEDLLELLEQLEQNGEATPSLAQTASFRSWSKTLQAYAAEESVRHEAEFWMEMAEQGKPLPIGRLPEPDYEKYATVIEERLDTGTTKKLLSEAGNAYRTQINDLLLTALYRAFRAWTNETSFTVALEGHGREPLGHAELATDRTVGWFTSAYPVRLECPLDQIGEQIQAVKERLRAVPRKGIGYGMHKYLRRTPGLGALPPICFNYLGQLDQREHGASLKLAPAWTGPFHSPDAVRPYLIEFNLMLDSEELIIRASLPRSLSQRPEIVQFIADFRRELEQVALHCCEQTMSRFTPSDFPLGDLNSEELTLVPANAADIYTLAPMQEGMLFHALLDPHSASYNGQVELELHGALDEARFAKAWSALVQRHDILRTIYRWEGLRKPHQIVLPELHAPLTTMDLDGVDDRLQAARMREAKDAQSRTPFDLSGQAPMRCLLLRTAPERTVMAWTFHHIALDGWSVFLLIHELLELYHNMPLKPAGQFKDYIRWWRELDKSQADAFWTSYLEGFREPTPLPGKRAVLPSHQAGPKELRKKRYELGAPLTARLDEAARRIGVTLNTFIQASWGILLARYSGHTDVVYGVTVSGRPSQLDEVEQTAGLFINSLPFRIRFEATHTVKQLLQELQDMMLDIKEYEYTPLTAIQERSALPGGTPVFESLLIFQNYPINETLHDGSRELRVSGLQGMVDIHYNMLLEFTPGESLQADFYFEAREWEEAFIDRMMGHLRHLLEQLAERHGEPVGSLQALTEQEACMLLEDWSARARVHTAFEDQEEVYRGVNRGDDDIRIYILNHERHPVPPGVPGEVYICSGRLEEHCGSWSSWMKENAVPHPFRQEAGMLLYPTGDIGVWRGEAAIELLDLI